MDNMVYVYFGDDLFGKLQYFSDMHLPRSSKSIKCKMFNSLKSASNSVIDDLHLGWSFLIYKIGKNFYHTGFITSEQGSSEVFQEHRTEINISCGATDVYAFSCDGNLFYYSTQNPDNTLFYSSNREQSIEDVKTGDQFTIVLFDDGSVCLLNLHEENPFEPFQLQIPIIQVACGKEHALFLSKFGQVLSYGSGRHGQLGHGSIESKVKPTVLEALDGVKMKSVSCGGWHSTAISEAGDLYVWGWNESGQLGFPCTELHSNTLPLNEIETVCCLPKIVELEEETQIVSVCCGSRHTVVLTGNSQVWSWGWNQYGQLGHGDYQICDKPCKVLFPDGFVPQKIKCAFWSTLILGSFSS